MSAAAASLSLSPLGGSINLVLVTAIIISLSAAAALTSLSLSLSRRAALSSLSLSGQLFLHTCRGIVGRSVTANIGWYVVPILHDQPSCNIDIT